MTRKLVWSSAARRDLSEYLLYITRDQPLNALAVAERVGEAAEFLAKRPIGRPSRVPGLFEKSIAKTSLIALYELQPGNELHILRLVHMSRNWPEGTLPEDS